LGYTTPLGKLTPVECELAFTTNTAADLAA